MLAALRDVYADAGLGYANVLLTRVTRVEVETYLLSVMRHLEFWIVDYGLYELRRK